MQYKIISVPQMFSRNRALEKLTREVNEAISLGWEPLGGLAIGGTILYQAMIKRRQVM
jgi:hypothetical protein